MRLRLARKVWRRLLRDDAELARTRGSTRRRVAQVIARWAFGPFNPPIKSWAVETYVKQMESGKL